jgi:membrane protease YdiL (CAAX protease family)
VTFKKRTLIITGGITTLLFLYVGLRLVLASRTLAAEWKLGLIFSIAMLFLLGGLAGLDLALRSALRSVRQEISLPVVFVLAYLLPVLVFLAPEIEKIPFISFPGEAFTWYFIWQALFMGAYQLNRLRKKISRDTLQTLRRRLPGALLTGGITGLGLWLAGTFIISIFTAQMPDPIHFSFPPLLKVAMLAATLGIAPWAEEKFFREQLLEQWQPRMGNLGASLVSAIIFATLQVRPLLWLPAFLFGLGTARLAQHTKSVLAPAAAHLIFNSLMLLLGWNAVI